jgi:hypothetical protein
VTAPLRLAAGLGFYGDSWQPVRAALERGDVHYVCSDHLAELTLAILQKDRVRDAALGYTRDVVPMLAELWPLARRVGAKFVLNAGGLNPRGAADALAQALRGAGERARIAVVTGDALLDRLDALRAAGETLAHLDTGASIDAVRDRLLFANAYLGAEPIAQALAQGADIVLTGRVADATLFLGPLLHHFDWPRDDWARLAQGVAVGHLLECSGQGAGGNFGSAKAWAKVPDFTHIGYGLAEVREDGSAVIGKAPGTGGRINFHTLRQQLLYEVHDPHAYVTPDVVLDLGTIALDDLGDDRVRVSGAGGKPRPGALKVVAGYDDGWMGHAVVGFCWPDALRKARAVEASIRTQVAERRLPCDELVAEYLGLDTFLGPHAARGDDDELNEVWLRMALRSRDKRAADAFPRMFPWLALSGPPYMGGFHGIAPASRLLGLWPTLVRREQVEPQVRVELIDA